MIKFLVVILCCFLPNLHAQCKRFSKSPFAFPDRGTSTEAAKELVAYLHQLYFQGVITISHLEGLRESITIKEIKNPITLQEAQSDPSKMIHREGLNAILAKSNFAGSRDLILDWVDRKLQKEQLEKKEKERGEQGTYFTQELIEFAQIEPGTFTMEGKGGQKVPAEITNSFGIGRILVTQFQWSVVMGENPSIFHSGSKTTLIDANGKKIKMQPDHPVENVSWDDVQSFLGRLNNLSLTDDPLIYRLVRNHQSGTVYRLPTSAEWEFVAKNRGRHNDTYHFGKEDKELIDYAWVSSNSLSRTHKVATRKPLEVDGEKIYDIHGNVEEWVQDRYSPEVNGGKDPLGGPKEIEERVTRGGGFTAWEFDAEISAREYNTPDFKSAGLGFRLVAENPTQSFIKFLKQLVKDKVLSKIELDQLRESLEKGKLINPISLAEKNPLQLKYYAQWEGYLANPMVDIPSLKSWVENNSSTLFDNKNQ